MRRDGLVLEHHRNPRFDPVDGLAVGRNQRLLDGALHRRAIRKADPALLHVAIQDRQVGIENIQKTVADYYKIRLGDMHAKRRSRSVARPRQLAMALSKELTNHSLPEIGDSFGGRDHTTVLHAVRRIEELRENNREIREDYNNLLRILTA